MQCKKACHFQQMHEKIAETLKDKLFLKEKLEVIFLSTVQKNEKKKTPKTIRLVSKC